MTLPSCEFAELGFFLSSVLVRNYMKIMVVERRNSRRPATGHQKPANTYRNGRTWPFTVQIQPLAADLRYFTEGFRALTLPE
jgi:hypothetical protein